MYRSVGEPAADKVAKVTSSVFRIVPRMRAEMISPSFSAETARTVETEAGRAFRKPAGVFSRAPSGRSSAW